MKEWFYTITESMLELGLRGTELNLFAVIYGYSQRGDGCCYATRKELATRCGVNSTRTIDTAAAALIEKGLIRKFTLKKEDKFLTAYSYCGKTPEGVQKLHGGCAKIAQGVGQNLPGGCAKIAHMEKEEEKKVVNNTTPTPPSLADVTEYCKTRGFADPAGFADYYIAYNNAREWKMKDGKPIQRWKQNILAWEKNNKSKSFSSPTNQQSKVHTRKTAAEIYGL